MAFKEKKDMLKSYIEQVEDHTVNSSTILMVGLSLKGQLFQLNTSVSLVRLLWTQRYDRSFDRADGGIEIQQYFQTASEIVISSVLNVILVVEIFFNLSAFFVHHTTIYCMKKTSLKIIRRNSIRSAIGKRDFTVISDTLEDIITCSYCVFRMFSTWFMFHNSRALPYFVGLLLRMFSALIPVLSTILVLLPWIAAMIPSLEVESLLFISIWTVRHCPLTTARTQKDLGCRTSFLCQFWQDFGTLDSLEFCTDP